MKTSSVVAFRPVKNNQRANVINHASNSISNVNSLRPSGCSAVLSFGNNLAKNRNQILSIAPEYQGVLDPVYKLGGLGNVTGEAATAFHKHDGVDIRTFIPYYAPENGDGKIKIRTSDGKFKAVETSYQLQQGEQFVLHVPEVKGKDTGYKILEDTGIDGFIKKIRSDYSGTDNVPYKVFKIEDTGRDGKPIVYVVHTPDLAKYDQAYGGTKTGAYGGAYGGGAFSDLDYSIHSKATVDAVEKMTGKEFGSYNPANVWLHDRQAFPALMEISQRSSEGNQYWDGVLMDSRYHNPGRGYQGHYKCPLDIDVILGNDKTIEQLKKNPDDFKFVRDCARKIETVRQDKSNTLFSPEDILSKEEMARLKEIYMPIYGGLLDEKGEYNLCLIPVQSKKVNPYNNTLGTVSRTYGKEMCDPNTSEIAEGLTSKFASVDMISPVNGSTPANLKLFEVGNFGPNGNGFTDEIKAGFRPFTQTSITDAKELYAIKQSNKEWLINTISNATKQNELPQLFFDEGRIKAGSSVLGGFSEFKKGDTLFIGWGRPDPQKGFATTFESVLQFLTDKNVPQEQKNHAKFLVGAGAGQSGWAKDATEWATIQEKIKQIQELENGRYKGNVCYVNGFFPNRFVACADYSLITSRYEPCGITPLESYAAGTPVLSNNTGGSPDFVTAYKGGEITNQTGFLTEHAFKINPEIMGKDSNLSGAELDSARVEFLGKENAANISSAMDISLNNQDGYMKMMQNTLGAKVDWHENSGFNQGKSASQIYLKDIFHVDGANIPEESKGPLKTLYAPEPASYKKAVETIKSEAATSAYKEAATAQAQEIKPSAQNFTASVKQSVNSSSSLVKNFKLTDKKLTLIAGAIAISGALIGGFIGYKKGKKTNNLVTGYGTNSIGASK